jgi:ABC-type nitrate/sulfonate/bicarbonate transport system ATPase subunit
VTALAEFKGAVLRHRRAVAGGTAEETVLDLEGSDWEVLPGDFIGLNAGGSSASRFYHELGAWLQGLRAPSAGGLRLFGKDVPLPPEWSARTARVFREGGLLPDITVRQNIELALAFSGLQESERAARTDEALERFVLSAYADAHPGTDAVGRGAEKRLNYARAWARRPSLLFIDQPFLHIRDHYARRVVGAVNELIAAGGAVVFTSNRKGDLLPGSGGLAEWRPNRRYSLRRGKLLDFHPD